MEDMIAPIEGDTPQPVENRGLPYHFTEENITDEPHIILMK